MKRRFLCLVLVFCSLCLLALPACGALGVGDTSSTPNQAQSVSDATTHTFADVPADAWYADAASYCFAHGIMGPTTNSTFSPGKTMTRSALAAVLYRMAGSPSVETPPRFTDVAEGTWYRDAISWVSQMNILSGYGDGVFGVDDPVTREQAATILWRYSGSPASDSAQAFADGAAISPWALPGVNWARADGILSGKAANRFQPKAALTRGEAAVIVYHYLHRSPDDAPAGSDEILVISVAGHNFTALLEENASSRALVERLPLTVNMGELNGNEKYFYLPDDLPTAPEQPGSIQAGDLMLYGFDCLVLFYQDFSSSYSYTPLGRIADPDGLAEAVGSGNVEVTFHMQT